MKDLLADLTTKQVKRLRCDWLNCVEQIANEPDPQPENFLAMIGQVGRVSNGLRVFLLLLRCYHLTIPILTTDGKPVALDDVVARFFPVLADLHNRVPLSREHCPKCGANETRIFRQFGLDGRPAPEMMMAADLDYAVFKYSCLWLGYFDRICGACRTQWQAESDNEERRILGYLKDRIASGEPWIRYLEQVRADNEDTAQQYILHPIRRSIAKRYPEFPQIMSDAQDLLVPLFDADSRPRTLEAVRENVHQAKKAFYEKYPQPTDKCPKCDDPGIVRITGYPSPALCAAERLGYAGSSGCLGSSTAQSRMCMTCGARWQSSIPYELSVFEYLNQHFPWTGASSITPSEAVDFSIMKPIGKCPQCGDNVYELEMSYRCRRAVTDSEACSFRSGKIILQQPISPEDMQQLLSEGRTRVLNGFKSNRTKRRFSAALAVSSEGKLGFEFDEKTKARIEKAKQKAEVARRK
jgi:hypothetical protein